MMTLQQYKFKYSLGWKHICRSISEVTGEGFTENRLNYLRRGGSPEKAELEALKKVTNGNVEEFYER